MKRALSGQHFLLGVKKKDVKTVVVKVIKKEVLLTLDSKGSVFDVLNGKGSEPGESLIPANHFIVDSISGVLDFNETKDEETDEILEVLFLLGEALGITDVVLQA